MNDKNIIVYVSDNGESYEISTYPNEYRSLMQLIYDRTAIEGFGECLGMGKCGTCLIEILECRHTPTFYERNENTTLTKAGHTDKKNHLSCQIMVDEYLDGLKINVL